MDQTTGTLLAHPARAALTALDTAVEALQEANLWSLSEHELLDLRIDVAGTLARLQSAILSVTREVDGRGAAVAVGAPSTATWLRGRLLMHPGAAKAEVALAKDLDSELVATGAALRAGDIGLDQARAVTRAVHDLPCAVDAQTRGRGESFMLEQAQQFDPSALHRVGRHLVLTLDPERGERLEREEAMQAHRQEFTVGHGLDGSRPVRGRFGPEDGAFIDSALEALAAPRPAEDGAADARPPAQRRAEALIEVLKLAVTSDGMSEHGGEPVTLTVTTTADYVSSTGDEPLGPAATLDDGTPLSPETTRRLGCDAWLLAAIKDTDGHVLDIGRMSRIVPRPMRRALVSRDGGCAFPGCGRPPRWCHAHHIRHWAHGGPTCLQNLVLLCGHHHRAIHHDGWEVDIGPHGRPRFTPPAWVDPSQVPRPAWRPPDQILLT